MLNDPLRSSGSLPELDERRICVVLNEGSGQTRRSGSLIDEVEARLSGHGEIRRVAMGRGIESAARKAVEDGFNVLVPAGGDGTIMTVAGVAAERGVPLGILPFGTFNFFARGLGLPEDPVEAVDLLLDGKPKDVPVGEVNGRIFLNNASLGIYPMILREREAVYRRFGRRRIAAHWSVAKTFLKVDKPLRLTLETAEGSKPLRTPLLFVARSAFQLRHFEIEGAECVEHGSFSVFTAHDGTRLDLFRQSLRLARHAMVPGEDFDFHCLSEFTVRAERPAILVACDGEKFLMDLPLHFRMREEPLRVLAPSQAAA